jgi:eukaryotic-like serine/threonine-protein kinase
MSGPKPEDDALVGTLVNGKYRIDRMIGRGGMGAVFQATHTTIGKRVALKFLDREAARDLDSVARFQREAESASAVESAHIVQIFDSGASDDRPFLVMELLSGEDLRARLRRQGKIPLPEVVHIAGQVLRALMRAHAEGIVHRDLKPDNVFLCQRDDDPMFVKIVDFGISKVSRKTIGADTLTRRGVVLGTAFYMSPEQAQAFPDIDGRTDLYSLGTIMYEALAGRPPHIGSAYEAVLIDICTRDADRVCKHAPAVPDAIAEVIAKALERDRAKRFQSAEEFHDALALAAPGLIRTSGPTLPDVSSPDGRIVTPPAPALITPASSNEQVPAVLGTGAGTAVRPSGAPPGVQRRRTIVTALVAALGAFAITVFLMAQPSSSAPSDSKRAAAAVSAELATASVPPAAPDAATSAPIVAPVAPEAIASGKKTPPIKTARIKPTGTRPTATAAAGKPPATGSSGVASGLTLDPRPP